MSFAAKYSAQNKRHGFFNIFWALYLFKKMHRENDNSTIKISYFFLYSIAAYKVKKNDIEIKKNLNSPNLNELICSKMSTWQKPASQRLAGRPSNPPWVYPITGCAGQSSDVDVSSFNKIHQCHCYSKTVSYVLTKLKHVPSQMRKTTKLTTLEKWPKNLWKRVPLHTPMQWHGTPGRGGHWGVPNTAIP